MASDNSFDVVSKIDVQEVSNAIQQALKEVHTRFDLKDSKSDIAMEGKDAIGETAGGLCWLWLFDSIHHRGQLSTHIRPMGGKVPSIYGESYDAIDERKAREAQAG